MNRELDRLIASVAESYYEQPHIEEAATSLGFDPQVERARMQGMLRRIIDDHDRFYVRKAVAEERTLFVAEVAERYGLPEDWVRRCAGLRKIAFKVGKFLKYRESDLQEFEKSRSKVRGYQLDSRKIMRQIPETTEIAPQRFQLVKD